MAMSDALLAVLLFLIFRPVSFALSLAALVFRLIQTAIIATGLLALQGAWLLSRADDAERMLFFLDLHRHGYDLGLFFFAVNCVLTGLLVIRSGWFARLLGIGLIAGGPVYLAGSLCRFFAPELLPYVQPAYVVPLIAESAFCLWLLFGRVRQASVAART